MGKIKHLLEGSNCSLDVPVPILVSSENVNRCLKRLFFINQVLLFLLVTDVITERSCVYWSTLFCDGNNSITKYTSDGGDLCGEPRKSIF